MSNKHEIKTLQNILDCVDKSNIENFMVDFRNYLDSAISMKELAEAMADYEGLPKEAARITTTGFTWINDGKHEMSIEIGVRNK